MLQVLDSRLTRGQSRTMLMESREGSYDVPSAVSSPKVHPSPLVEPSSTVESPSLKSPAGSPSTMASVVISVMHRRISSVSQAPLFQQAEPASGYERARLFGRYLWKRARKRT